MTWAVKPLEGKYYGTIVEDGDDSDQIEVWVTQPPTPSARQLAALGVETEAQALEEDSMCDSHYETARSYAYACAIADALNAVDAAQPQARSTADALLEYAQRIEDRFLALAGTVSQAEVDRALKEISAEKAVCFSPTPAKSQD